MEKKHEDMIREKIRAHEHSPILWKEDFVWSQIRKEIRPSKPSYAYAWMSIAASIVIALGISIFGYTLFRKKQMEVEQAILILEIKALANSKKIAPLPENSSAKYNVEEVCKDNIVPIKNIPTISFTKSAHTKDSIKQMGATDVKKDIKEYEQGAQPIATPDLLAENLSEESIDTVMTVVGIIPDKKFTDIRKKRIRIKYTRPLKENSSNDDGLYTLKISQ